MILGKIKITLAQYNIKWEDKIANQKKCEKLIRNAKNKGVDLIIFPEMTLTGYSMNIAKISESEASSPTISFFKKLAKRYNINIIFGVVLKEKNKKAKNMAMILDSKGKIISRYQKIHPFSYAKENKYFEAGQKLSVFKIKNVKCAMVICYDLRFPGLFEAISRHQPDAIIVIANWPQKRIKHWDLLLKARALDTQSFLVGVNRIGTGNNIKYNGHSSVYSPSGDRMYLAKKEKINSIFLDKKLIINTRKQFPSLKDKKFDIHHSLS